MVAGPAPKRLHGTTGFQEEQIQREIVRLKLRIQRRDVINSKTRWRDVKSLDFGFEQTSEWNRESEFEQFAVVVLHILKTRSFQ